MEQTIWLAVVIITAVIEAVTAGLVTIWFTIGALAALVAAFFGAHLAIQIVLFIAVSALSLVLTRPLVKKHILVKSEKTNADRLLGKTCEVVEDINNIKETGAIKIGGLTWSAKSESEPIKKGELVTVTEIKGVHVIVKPIDKNKEGVIV